MSVFCIPSWYLSKPYCKTKPSLRSGATGKAMNYNIIKQHEKLIKILLNEPKSFQKIHNDYSNNI